jgi:hypothetical protein
MRKPDLPSNGGYLEEAANRGRLFFRHLLLAMQKKMTRCRAAPGILATKQESMGSDSIDI